MKQLDKKKKENITVRSNLYHSIVNTISSYNTDEFCLIHTISDNPTKIPLSFDIHDYYELYYLVSGNIGYFIEGQEYRLEENDVLLINNKELHKAKFFSDIVYERISIYFKPEFIRSFQTESYDLLSCFERRKLGLNNKIEARIASEKKIYEYIKNIEYYVKANLPESNLMIMSFFIQMLVALNIIYKEKGIALSKNATYDSKTLSILDYINTSLHENILLEDLGRKFFVNKYYLCHTFKRNTGFTVMEYIAHKRIMKAKELLINGIPATEVCYMTGYNSYSNFYKVFKQLVGLSPKRYSKKNQSI